MSSRPHSRLPLPHYGWYTAGFLTGCVGMGVYLQLRKERHWREHGAGLAVPRVKPLYFFGEDRGSKEYWVKKGRIRDEEEDEVVVGRRPAPARRAP